MRTSIWRLIAEQQWTAAFTEKQPGLFARPVVVMEPDSEGFLQAFELAASGDPIREGMICAA